MGSLGGMMGALAPIAAHMGVVVTNAPGINTTVLVSVVPCSAVQALVPCSTVQAVVPCSTVQAGVPCSTVQAVVPCSAVQLGRLSREYTLTRCVAPGTCATVCCLC